MEPFVAVGLRVYDLMKMFDTDSQKIVMKFCKIYKPEKIGRIVAQAKTYPWWEKNPKAAFMKAVGEVNRQEKNG